MNKARRAELQTAINIILAASEELSKAKGILESARDEEQEYHDNLPENMQQGEKGEKAEAAVTELEAAVDKLDTIINDLEDAQTSAETAQE